MKRALVFAALVVGFMASLGCGPDVPTAEQLARLPLSDQPLSGGRNGLHEAYGKVTLIGSQAALSALTPDDLAALRGETIQIMRENGMRFLVLQDNRRRRKAEVVDRLNALVRGDPIQDVEITGGFKEYGFGKTLKDND